MRKNSVIITFLFLFLFISSFSLHTIDFMVEQNYAEKSHKNENQSCLDYDVYSKHKSVLIKTFKEKKLNQVNNKQKENKEHIKGIKSSYIVGDTKTFFVIDDTFTNYIGVVSECISISSHAYFFVQRSIINAYGRESIEEQILIEKNLFENQIYSNEIRVFGNIEGVLGNIGDGKVVIFFANLPSGVAGYFDPMNEYNQTYLDDNGMSDYKTNEWEMIYLDWISRFETTLAHEFQHLIHYNHDAYESRWFDEGCSELAGLITDAMPTDWNNITPFAYYYEASPHDSLTYWNYWSEGGLDVRTDYGGAYLFLLYIYEQLGEETLTSIVNDTYPSILSISSILAPMNMTFNDFYLNWQTALIIDDTTMNSKYGFYSIDFNISTLRTISANYANNIYVPYYGIYTVSLNYGQNKYETSITNTGGKTIGYTIIQFQNSILTNITQRITTNSTLLYVPETNNTNTLIAFSYFDTDEPKITGAFGLGGHTPVFIRNIDPFYLTVTNPTFVKNITHLTIYDLHILFINGSDISYGNAWDNVTIIIFRDYYESSHVLVYNTNLYYGWGLSLNITHLNPGTYTIRLFATTGTYYYEDQIHMFTISFEILFTLPVLTINNITNNIYVECNITISPIVFRDFVYENAQFYAFIYNASHHFINKTHLELLNGNTWILNTSCSDLQNGHYYVFVRVLFEGDYYNSFRSNHEYYNPKTTIKQRKNISLIIGLSVSASVLTIGPSTYFIIKKKIIK